jgi:hypothetical protein
MPSVPHLPGPACPRPPQKMDRSQPHRASTGLLLFLDPLPCLLPNRLGDDHRH